MFYCENRNVRADRLVSLVLLLRQRGRMTAGALAEELEVSVRTVVRDFEALSAAGVPVYADRGRHGGYALLPGFRTELTGLNKDEALALLTAGSGREQRPFGFDSALSSAMRKIVDALPESHRSSADIAMRRMLVEPETDLLSRRHPTENIPAGLMHEVRRSVLEGRKLRIHYTSPEQAPSWRTVDPIGLVTVRGSAYLLATASGQDRTYRLSRMTEAEALDAAAERHEDIDLERVWTDRVNRFLSEDHIAAHVRVRAARRDDLLNNARAVRSETRGAEDWLQLDVSFEDLRHAIWALWQLGADAEALSPETLRDAMRDRALSVLQRYE